MSIKNLGAHPVEGGVCFRLISSKRPILGIFSPSNPEPILEIPLKKKEGYWESIVPSVAPDALYAYQFDEKWVIDPYAKELNTSSKWGEQVYPMLGKVFPQTDFDWEDDQPLRIPYEKTILYEMHVRSYTQDPSSHVEHPGTFLGMIEKIPHLVDLGITAVELMPIFEFDETLHHEEHLFNYWGYSTENFFAPMASYGTIVDFKKLVKALHKAGIEVVLDVVYNHVGSESFQLIDKEVYFILDPNGEHTNYTGCGNTIHCNHPLVIDFILSSLRYWVQEMHVDGFRFDLASIFCRGVEGEVLENPPLIDAIIADEALANTKMIAEPWDCGGLYQVDSFPGGDRFARWNSHYRDTVRQFMKGSDHQAGVFASVISKAHFPSINFITAHDGFSLRDLVTYNEKHNEENGEENRDGSDWNASWNCGHEGPTKNAKIRHLREKQIRNFLFTLCFSQDIPMLLMGDEYGHTRDGNNNTYCLDNRKNYFLWDELEKHEKIKNFVKKCIAIRKENFPIPMENFTWHGHKPHKPNWHDNSRFVAFSANGLYFAFNAAFRGTHLTLPFHSGNRIIDTALFNEDEVFVEKHYYLAPHSCLLILF